MVTRSYGETTEGSFTYVIIMTQCKGMCTIILFAIQILDATSVSNRTQNIPDVLSEGEQSFLNRIILPESINWRHNDMISLLLYLLFFWQDRLSL